jgi:hypothetical protein
MGERDQGLSPCGEFGLKVNAGTARTVRTSPMPGCPLLDYVAHPLLDAPRRCPEVNLPDIGPAGQMKQLAVGAGWDGGLVWLWKDLLDERDLSFPSMLIEERGRLPQACVVQVSVSDFLTSFVEQSLCDEATELSLTRYFWLKHSDDLRCLCSQGIPALDDTRHVGEE